MADLDGRILEAMNVLLTAMIDQVSRQKSIGLASGASERHPVRFVVVPIVFMGCRVCLHFTGDASDEFIADVVKKFISRSSRSLLEPGSVDYPESAISVNVYTGSIDPDRGVVMLYTTEEIVRMGKERDEGLMESRSRAVWR